MSRKKIGVIGLGARGECFAKDLYAGTERAELFGLCDIDPDRTKKFCDYCGIEGARTFTDPEEFMRQSEMDAVIITTPDFTHLDVARLAFANGKHAYLEKPLDVSSERCREIIRLHSESDVTAFVGFNLRANPGSEKVREIVQSGILGEIIHIEGLEQIASAHIAAFMRRFHRNKIRSGGLLNTKCSHDLDIIQWVIGHEHRIRRVVSFGGTNIFKPEKAPATHCSKCPDDIRRRCPYIDRAGFVFPVGGKDPIHKTEELALYGGDLCVYNDDKDIIDTQTVLLEWDNGTRGNFNLQGFQSRGKREMKVWGEKGLLTRGFDGAAITVTLSETGDTMEYSFAPRKGGHGGTDPLMLGRFLDAIEGKGDGNSGLPEGLAATLIAEKALESLETGKVIDIAAEDYA